MVGSRNCVHFPGSAFGRKLSMRLSTLLKPRLWERKPRSSPPRPHHPNLPIRTPSQDRTKESERKLIHQLPSAASKPPKMRDWNDLLPEPLQRLPPMLPSLLRSLTRSRPSILVQTKQFTSRVWPHTSSKTRTK